MINIQKCRVTYRATRALDIQRPLQIQRGEKVGIIGSNGAGKTTLIKAILGLISYEGSIRTSIPRGEIAVHMQQNAYVDTVTVKTIMEMVLGCGLKHHAKAMELIEYFGFEGCLGKRYKQLSGGEKQRLTIILVMCEDSPLTIFDEVTSGLDFETRQRLMAKIVDYYKDRPTTLLLVSHYYEELEQLADKILYIHEGQVVDYGDKDALFRKYCGKTVIVTERTDRAERVLKTLAASRLQAPNHLLAIRCDDEETEAEITDMLRKADLDYKRSSNDIEIMTLNARAAGERRGK